MPESIHQYDIVEKIGEGGMGVVYKAMHRTLERPVAIKRLAAHLAKNQEMLQRFLKEAKLQAKLSHANVVNIFDLLEDDGEIYLVMEYVNGQSVKELLAATGRLPIRKALHIAHGVLAGLSFMHKNNIVHRDIKPSNIILSDTDLVKVTDFGIARLMEDDSGLTRFGAGVGTLQYMAPELLKSGEVSFSVDIYAMGVTLYEMLCGKTPFTGNTDLEVMLGHIDKPPPPLDLPEDEAGTACKNLVLKALAKTPAERFPNAEAFMAEVRRIGLRLEPETPETAAVRKDPPPPPAPSTPAPATMYGEAPPAQTPEPAKPRKRTTAYLAGLAALVVLGAGSYFLLRQQPPTAPPSPPAPLSAQTKPETAPSPPTPAPAQTAPPATAAPAQGAAGTHDGQNAQVAQTPSSAPEPAPAQPAQPAQTQQDSGQIAPHQTVYIQGKGARLRQAPDTASEVLASLDANTRLEVIENQGEWLKVNAPQGLIGYVAAAQTAQEPVTEAKAPPQAAPRAPAKTAPKKNAPGGDTGWRIIK